MYTQVRLRMDTREPVSAGVDFGVEQRLREENADRSIEWAMQEQGGIP